MRGGGEEQGQKGECGEVHCSVFFFPTISGGMEVKMSMGGARTGYWWERCGNDDFIFHRGPLEAVERGTAIASSPLPSAVAISCDR